MDAKGIGKGSGVDVEILHLETINETEVWDPNLSSQSPTSDTESQEKVPNEAENSPYEEVRIAVPNYDQDVPANTIRAWVLGILLSVIGAAVNTIFSMRSPSIQLGTVIAQLIAYLLGNLWAKTVPSKRFTTFGVTWSLNPGPFNVKEHTVIVVMAGVSFSPAYATDIIMAQTAFYKQDFGLAFQLLLVITTQSIGYGIAGLLRKALVYPAAMIWPGNLVSVTLLHAMHGDEEPRNPAILGGNMSKYKWFGVVSGLAFVYYFIPGFLAQFLSIFAFITWVYPNSPVVNQLFGGTTGLSLLPITFDWTQVTGYLGNPMIPPWHAIANTLLGTVLFYLIGASALHYSGTWYAKWLPISDSGIYDNTGIAYNVTRVITPQYTLDVNAYRAYSPLFISTTFAISYGLSFASVSSLIVYTWLHYREQILGQFRTSRGEKIDVHMAMMLKYKEAPTWWYATLFILMLGLSLFTNLFWPTQFAWWAFLLAVGFASVMAIPIGIVQAITNQQLGLNVITEFIMGYMQPGRPLALMLFKTYGYITAVQGLTFVSDLKLGHYMKIPPRTMFASQVVATTVSSIVQVFTLRFALHNIKGVCTPEQAQHFTCPGAKVFYSASVIWGLLGPSRIFSPGQTYQGLLWGFPLGVSLPVLLYYVGKKFPRSIVKYAMAPLILGGSGSIPPATPLNYLTWGIVGYVFQSFIKKRHSAWWSRLNYITASGLDTGLAVCTIFIFLVFTMNNIEAPKWWGNDVVSSTLDAKNKAIRAIVGEGETFGPKTW